MKLIVGLGTFLFTGGLLILVSNWIIKTYYSWHVVWREGFPVGWLLLAAFMMVIPTMALIGWAIGKAIRKKE
jgi:hypothetical protein